MEEKNNIVNLYMKKVGEYPLLTENQEKILAKRIKEGDAEAKELLFNSNLRLVVFIAKQFKPNQTQGFMDFIQEGNIGLLKAVERFDPEEGNKFSTFAFWWIRQAISESISNNSSTIRVPAHANNLVSKIKKKKEEMEKDSGVEPTYQELAEELNIKEEDVRNLMLIKENPLSLDYETDEDGSTTVLDLIQNVEAADPHYATINKMNREALIDVIRTIGDIESEIIIQRFGLDDGIPKSLDDIGRNIKYSRERVRQLEAKAMRKLSNPIRKAALKELF